jgi:diguanylate cyclase (GGDEF)-like protein
MGEPSGTFSIVVLRPRADPGRRDETHGFLLFAAQNQGVNSLILSMAARARRAVGFSRSETLFSPIGTVHVQQPGDWVADSPRQKVSMELTRMFRWPGSRREPAAEGSTATLERVVGCPRDDDDAADQALDAFVQVLRAFGQHAFDLDHESVVVFGEQCTGWARHLLNLVPPPMAGAGNGRAPDTSGTSGGGQRVVERVRRDWASVVQFMVARRKREQEHVNKALGELRQSIWTFAQSLGTALVEDQQMDTRLKAQIERLKVAVERLSPEELRDEVITTASSLSSLVSERQRLQRERLETLGSQVKDLTGQLHEAKEESARDPLTPLANRKGFDEFLNRMVFMRDVFAETAALLMLDVDRFKAVNDTYGHRGGDVVLRAVADCLARSFPRKSDLVARYGGEEFAIILPATTVQDAKRLAERTLMLLRPLEIPHDDAVIQVTASIGIGQLGRSESIQDWLDRADQALYRAKAGGRDCVVEAVAPG